MNQVDDIKSLINQKLFLLLSEHALVLVSPSLLSHA